MMTVLLEYTEDKPWGITCWLLFHIKLLHLSVAWCSYIWWIYLMVHIIVSSLKYGFIKISY